MVDPSPSSCGEQVKKSCLLEICYGQNIHMMFRRQFVWKVQSCLRDVSFMRDYNIVKWMGRNSPVTSAYIYYTVDLLMCLSMKNDLLQHSCDFFISI